MRTGVEGVYKFEAVYPDGRVEVLRDNVHNLITDQGFDYFFTGGDGGRWYAYCSLGTGTTGPTETDTQLEDFVVSQIKDGALNSAAGGSIGYYPYYAFMRTIYLFPLGAITTFYEAGIGCANDGTKLTSRIVLRDAEGALDPITVPATAQLRVSYDFRLHPPFHDVIQDLNIAGVDTVATIRAAYVNDYSASTINWYPFVVGINLGFVFGRNTWYCDYLDDGNQDIYSGSIGDIFGSPTSRITDAIAAEVGPYGTGQYYRDFTFTFTESATPIRSQVFSTTTGVWQIQYDPPIDRTHIGGTKITMRASLFRYTSNLVPYGCTEQLESTVAIQSAILAETPVYVGIGSAALVTSDTSVDVGRTGSIAVDDAMFAFIMGRSPVTAPVGWALIEEAPTCTADGFTQYYYAYYKLYEATDPTTYTFTQTGVGRMEGRIVAYRASGVGTVEASASASTAISGVDTDTQDFAVVSASGVGAVVGAGTTVLVDGFTSPSVSAGWNLRSGGGGNIRTILGTRDDVYDISGTMSFGASLVGNGMNAITLILKVV